MSSTRMGRTSGWLLALSGGLFATFFGLVAAGQRGGETFFSNVPLAATMLGAAASAIAAGAVGVVAVRRHDRAPWVIAAVVVGTVVTLWTVGEIAFPH